MELSSHVYVIHESHHIGLYVIPNVTPRSSGGGFFGVLFNGHRLGVIVPLLRGYTSYGDSVECYVVREER